MGRERIGAGPVVGGDDPGCGNARPMGRIAGIDRPGQRMPGAKAGHVSTGTTIRSQNIVRSGLSATKAPCQFRPAKRLARRQPGRGRRSARRGIKLRRHRSPGPAGFGIAGHGRHCAPFHQPVLIQAGFGI